MAFLNYTVQQLLSAVKKDLGGADFPAYTAVPVIDRKLTLLSEQFSHVIWRDYLTASPLALWRTSPIGGDAILLKSFRILPGGDAHIGLESSSTDYCIPLSLEEIKTFRASAHPNKKKIVYARGGEFLFIAKGDGLTTYGTYFVLRYPRRPKRVTSETGEIELPDGMLIDMLTLLVRKAMAPRVLKKDIDVSQEISAMVRQFYTSRQFDASEQEVKKVTEALT